MWLPRRAPTGAGHKIKKQKNLQVEGYEVKCLILDPKYALKVLNNVRN